MSANARNTILPSFLFVALALGTLAGADAAEAQAAAVIPRTADGRPDLSGTYDLATLTPLERAPVYGDRLFFTPEEAQAIEENARRFLSMAAAKSNPDRRAPPYGGDGSPPGAGGNVGGYNAFWIDRGDDPFSIDGKFRTSIIVDPVNGRLPKMTSQGIQNLVEVFSLFRPNTGTAWWLERQGPGPYDNPEQRPLGERCLLGVGSAGGPPMLPGTYNNLKTIVQTPDHLVIFIEMVHDARIVRMNSEHLPRSVRKWMGDSVGHWEGDTLVVDTTNFGPQPGLYFWGADENLHVVERFTRTDAHALKYSFTIEDPTVWTEPWSGEILWPTTDARLYEYACHEGNYTLGNILRGARLLEADIEGTRRR